MVSTSIYSFAGFDSRFGCFCRSYQQVQQCSHLDFLIVLFILMLLLFISLMFTKLSTILSRFLKRVHYFSLYFCEEVLHSSIVQMWKLIIYLRMAMQKCMFKATIIVDLYTVMRKVKFKIAVVQPCAYVKPSVDNPVKINCYKYQQQCEMWIDSRILRWALMKNDHKFSHKFSEKIPIEYFWNYFDSMGNNGSGFDMFINCLKMSLEEPSFFHLGHYSLLKWLTSEKCSLKSEEYICNLEIMNVIKANLPEFVQLINVQELLPIMEDKQLLTNRDRELLLSSFRTCTDKADYLLTELLITKGHCGYVLFLDCLENEHSHTGHCEVAEKISRELHNCQIRRPPKCSLKELQVWYHCKGLMNTREYIEAFDNFMYLSQSNDVRKFNYEVKHFVVTHNKTPEAEAFGLMMNALSFKIRCKDEKLRDVKFQIEQCIDLMTDSDNKRNFTGHWYLILSCWYYQQRNFQASRTYLEKAKSELVSGNSRALVLYVEASLLIEDKSGNEDKIIALLHDAIRGFRSRSSGGVSIMQMRCYLQEAHCHIGSSLSSPRIARRSQSQLHKAEEILSMLTKQLDGALPLRLKMQYYAILCDYHRVFNRKQEATDCICKGLSLDTDNKFKRDQQYLQHRKSSISLS